MISVNTKINIFTNKDNEITAAQKKELAEAYKKLRDEADPKKREALFKELDKTVFSKYQFTAPDTGATGKLTAQMFFDKVQYMNSKFIDNPYTYVDDSFYNKLTGEGLKKNKHKAAITKDELVSMILGSDIKPQDRAFVQAGLTPDKKELYDNLFQGSL